MEYEKWYSFYALAGTSGDLIHAMDDKLKLDSIKLQQIGAEIDMRMRTLVSDV